MSTEQFQVGPVLFDSWDDALKAARGAARGPRQAHIISGGKLLASVTAQDGRLPSIQLTKVGERFA